jgi:hypothetical protein
MSDLNEDKYELHLVFATKADRDWMAEIIQKHLKGLVKKGN